MESAKHERYAARVKHLEEYDADFVRKRRHFFITCTIRQLCIGLQYGVLLPSAWPYLKIFNSPAWLLGVLFSSARISGTLTSIILGPLYDKTKRYKSILLAVNVISIVGGMMYALPFSVWFLLLGRFLTGVGTGFMTVTTTEVAWITQQKTRTKIYARLNCTLITAMAFGPPLSMAFQQVHFQIGQWHIDYRNLPGLFGAFLWAIQLPITFWMVHDLAKDFIDVDEHVLNDKIEENDDLTRDNSLLVKNDEHLDFYDPEESLIKDGVDEVANRGTDESTSMKEGLKEIISSEIVVIFFSDIIIWLSIMRAETTVTIFTQNDFGWNIVETSLLYVGSNLVCVGMFTLLQIIGNKISELWWIVIGLSSQCTAGMIWLIFQKTRKELNVSVPLFCLAVSMDTASFPPFDVAAMSLLTKVVSMRMQGLTQGILDASCQFSLAIGPLWGVFLYSHTYLAGSLTLAMQFTCLVWFLLSHKRLRARKDKYCKEKETHGGM